MMEYRNILILCEGQTEELFVNRILAPCFQTKNIFVKPVLLGGVSHYAGIKRDLERLGKNEQYDILTTMLDYYKLPQDVPGVRTCKEGEPSRIAEHIEKFIYEDLKEKIKILLADDNTEFVSTVIEYLKQEDEEMTSGAIFRGVIELNNILEIDFTLSRFNRE